MMVAKHSKAAVDEVVRGSLNGKSSAEIKPLHVLANALNDVALDDPIYRVVPIEYLLKDVCNGTLTHVRIASRNWNDVYENPLLRQRYIDEVTNSEYGLEGVLEDTFGVCWTADSEESRESWEEFSHGLPAIRIRSTPRKLLSTVMNEDNPFFMLHHFIGKVSYSSKGEIDEWIGNPDVSVHLDSLGQSLALSVMKLRSHLVDEKEVRLVYSHSPAGNDWVQKEVEIEGDLCRLPFNWVGIVDGFSVGPQVADDLAASVAEALAALAQA